MITIDQAIEDLLRYPNDQMVPGSFVDDQGNCCALTAVALTEGAKLDLRRESYQVGSQVMRFFEITAPWLAKRVGMTMMVFDAGLTGTIEERKQAVINYWNKVKEVEDASA